MVKSRSELLILHVEFAAAFHQLLHGHTRVTTVLGSSQKRCITLIIYSINISTSLYQNGDALIMAANGCEMKCRLASTIAHVHFGLLPNQELNNICMAMLRGKHKQSLGR